MMLSLLEKIVVPIVCAVKFDSTPIDSEKQGKSPPCRDKNKSEQQEKILLLLFFSSSSPAVARREALQIQKK
jgi:hypothetical protein